MGAGRAGNAGRADRIADLATSQGVRVAVAESLTAGGIWAFLGRGEAASEWYRGAVVAYDEEVKFEVLGVTRGPVVTAAFAQQMADGVRTLGADVALGITGVGDRGLLGAFSARTAHVCRLRGTPAGDTLEAPLSGLASACATTPVRHRIP